MSIVEGIIAGVVAGCIMGIASEAGYRLGVIKSHLIVVDGSFALRLLNREPNSTEVYGSGTAIHLVTSAVFGLIYAVIARIIGFEARLTVAIVLYVLFLWLAMLMIALPIAGQGIMGNKIRQSVWAEQLVLHLVFGISFWWALGIA